MNQKRETMNSTSLLGKGVYSIPQAARIIHSDTRSVRRWVSGYETLRLHRVSPPIIISEIAGNKGEEVLTFQQLIEILFIKLFREHEVSMLTIRAAAKRASLTFNTPHPFAVKGLQTDGKDIFHLTEDQVNQSTGNEESISKRQLAQDLKNGQMVLLDFAQSYFRKIDYDKVDAARYWPLGKDRSVVIDPLRAFGQPIDMKNRVPTKALYSMFKGGDSAETISNWYGTTLCAVYDAIEFEKSLTCNN